MRPGRRLKDKLRASVRHTDAFLGVAEAVQSKYSADVETPLALMFAFVTRKVGDGGGAMPVALRLYAGLPSRKECTWPDRTKP
jgi:hypothetical protein